MLDPFEIYREDPSARRPALERPGIEQIRDVVARYAMDARRLALKWKSPERLIELTVAVVEQRTRNGDTVRS
jgi:hypothetical protein